jgi:hypothetical protein
MTELPPPTPPAEQESSFEIPEGILKARAHLRADLPALLASRWTRLRFALYSKDGRVKIAWNYLDLVREANRRGLADNEFIIELIEPGAGSEEEVDLSR